LDPRAEALKTPQVPQRFALCHRHRIRMENPLSPKYLARGSFCGLSHANSMSMAAKGGTRGVFKAPASIFPRPEKYVILFMNSGT